MLPGFYVETIDRHTAGKVGDSQVLLLPRSHIRT